MPVEQVTVPKAGESITEATLNRWFKPDGAYVKADEPIFEMGTDKASQEIVAPAAGGAAVAQIDTDATGPQQAKPDRKVGGEAKAAPAPKPGEKREAIASPAAQRVLAEAGVRAEDVKGTGRDGRVTKEDALEASG